MDRIDYTDAIFNNAETYADMDMICIYNAGGIVLECMGRELPQRCYDTGDYAIVGYQCPDCGEMIYLDDYSNGEVIINECPCCGFEF